MRGTWLAAAAAAAAAATTHALPLDSFLTIKESQSLTPDYGDDIRQTEDVISFLTPLENEVGDQGSPAKVQPTADVITKSCLSALNALRTEVGTVVPALAELKGSHSLENTAKGVVVQEKKRLFGTLPTACPKGEEISKDNANPGLIISFEKPTTPPSGTDGGTEPDNDPKNENKKNVDQKAESNDPIQSNEDCEALIREAYKKGLDDLKKTPNFNPEINAFDINTAPFNSTDVRNLTSIMWANSKAVGCVLSKNCEAGDPTVLPDGGILSAKDSHVLYCKFDSTPTANDKPFSLSLYNAMLGLPPPSGAYISSPSVLLFILAIPAIFVI